MKTYRVMGWGKRVGIIAPEQFFVIDLTVDNEGEARAKIYEYFEDISQLEVKLLPNKNPTTRD